MIVVGLTINKRRGRPWHCEVISTAIAGERRCFDGTRASEGVGSCAPSFDFGFSITRRALRQLPLRIAHAQLRPLFKKESWRDTPHSPAHGLRPRYPYFIPEALAGRGNFQRHLRDGRAEECSRSSHLASWTARRSAAPGELLPRHYGAPLRSRCRRRLCCQCSSPGRHRSRCPGYRCE